MQKKTLNEVVFEFASWQREQNLLVAVKGIDYKSCVWLIMMAGILTIVS